ncbi:MAG: hypothetical protein LRS48_03950 [Desulfurococcales archaeon]|nr:hypothetical protein [Desulfurococcales archaeon]
MRARYLPPITFKRHLDTRKILLGYEDSYEELYRILEGLVELGIENKTMGLNWILDLYLNTPTLIEEWRVIGTDEHPLLVRPKDYEASISSLTCMIAESFLASKEASSLFIQSLPRDPMDFHVEILEKEDARSIADRIAQLLGIRKQHVKSERVVGEYRNLLVAGPTVYGGRTSNIDMVDCFLELSGTRKGLPLVEALQSIDALLQRYGHVIVELPGGGRACILGDFEGCEYLVLVSLDSGLDIECYRNKNEIIKYFENNFNNIIIRNVVQWGRREKSFPSSSRAVRRG